MSLPRHERSWSDRPLDEDALAMEKWALKGFQEHELVLSPAQRYTYGLTVGEADALVNRYSGRCYICSEPGRDVDHDHVTGKVRGFLCNPCNRMLGSAYDDPGILRSGATYLEEAR